MSEYILNSSLDSYVYPSHMKRPDGFFGSNFFEKWIPNWRTYLGHLKDKPNVIGIEIGVFNGDATVYCAEEIANGEGSVHYAIDINKTEELKNNIEPYNNVAFIKGSSQDILRKFHHNGIYKEFADYIYIDGDHTAKAVLMDMIMSWEMLKVNGIMIIDDFLWGKHLDQSEDKDIFTPKLAVEAFLAVYRKQYDILNIGWQVALKKNEFKYPKEEQEANYQK